MTPATRQCTAITDEQMILSMLKMAPTMSPSDAIRQAMYDYKCTYRAASRAYGRVLEQNLIIQIEQVINLSVLASSTRSGGSFSVPTVLCSWRRA